MTGIRPAVALALRLKDGPRRPPTTGRATIRLSARAWLAQLLAANEASHPDPIVAEHRAQWIRVFLWPLED